MTNILKRAKNAGLPKIIVSYYGVDKIQEWRTNRNAGNRLEILVDDVWRVWIKVGSVWQIRQ